MIVLRGEESPTPLVAVALRSSGAQECACHSAATVTVTAASQPLASHCVLTHTAHSQHSAPPLSLCVSVCAAETEKSKQTKTNHN
eukprot:scaffold2066_cov229-Ochromonas_danica.AAC.17